MPEAKRKELKESAEQSGFVMVNKKRDSSGRVRVSGGQSLRESAEYTDEFANFICSKFGNASQLCGLRKPHLALK